MKAAILIPTMALLSFASPTVGQLAKAATSSLQVSRAAKNTATARTPPNEETVIRGLMRNPDAFYRGVGAVQLHRMGDVAAAAIIRIIGTRSLSNAESDEILDIVYKSFEHIDAVSPSNRNPRTTLVLLNHLNLTTESQEVKKKIESTREFVLTASGSNSRPTSIGSH